ncbi:hypothetical protein Ahy_B03g063353 isoform A [Arachis hypogaea]|uniref:Uncharacterized protein n=1 Tax=Arachis hypogaea TaxID=3818 RepID=A0A444ZX38_ARAHY|nr:hypothetical protein Ahy_B03g063353 isoform A [Arachis hypogaea]
MEATYAVYVADEEQHTQNYPQNQPKEVKNTILTASNLVTVATGSKTASQVTTKPTALTTIRRGRPTFVRGNPISTRGRGSTFWGRVAVTSTIPPTPTQYAIATPPPPPQTRIKHIVVRLSIGSKALISARLLSVAVPGNGCGSMTQDSMVKPIFQAQTSAPFRPLISLATQNRFRGFMLTPSLRRKKSSGLPPSKPYTNEKKKRYEILGYSVGCYCYFGSENPTQALHNQNPISLIKLVKIKARKKVTNTTQTSFKTETETSDKIGTIQRRVVALKLVATTAVREPNAAAVLLATMSLQRHRSYPLQSPSEATVGIANGERRSCFHYSRCRRKNQPHLYRLETPLLPLRSIVDKDFVVGF